MCTGGGGGGGSYKLPPSPPEPPKASDSAVKAAMDLERKRAALAGGMQSTILTGGQGDISNVSVQKKTLLGL